MLITVIVFDICCWICYAVR